MSYADVVSFWVDEPKLYFKGGLPGIDGPAGTWEVHVHNGNDVPVFDVRLLMQDPIEPAAAIKDRLQMEWRVIAPRSTERVVIEAHIQQAEDGVWFGSPDFELRFADIDNQEWLRLERGQPVQMDGDSPGSA